MDLAEQSLEVSLYSLVNGHYNIYSSCIAQLETFIDKPSEQALRHWVGWIMKLETATPALRKIEVVRLCIFNRPEPAIHKQGLSFARQIIREDLNLSQDAAEVLMHALSSVLSLTQFDESLQSFALLLLAELGSKFFNLVLGQSIDLALQTFEKLKQRIVDLKGSVREDEMCLTYMEALNKLRDCYE